jgi:hypothetical protein
MSIFPGPTPPFTNPPIHPEYYQPSQFFIQNIILGMETTVFTTENHNYVIGQQVRLNITQFSGCRELNHKTGIVIAIPSLNSVILNIDSSKNVSAFTPNTRPTQSQIVAIGDINTGYISTTGPYIPLVTIPGSFVDISPN